MHLLKRIVVKILNIDSWHESDYMSKEYAKYTVNVVDRMSQNDPDIKVVEVGCGLGDIIGNVKNKNKLGFDLDKRIVLGARILHPLTKFRVGSFSDVHELQPLCLIAVNILHFLNPDYVERVFGDVKSNNTLKYVVIDELHDTGGTVYKYEYSGLKLLGDDYRIKYRSRRIQASDGACRYVVVYERKR